MTITISPSTIPRTTSGLTSFCANSGIAGFLRAKAHTWATRRMIAAMSKRPAMHCQSPLGRLLRVAAILSRKRGVGMKAPQRIPNANTARCSFKRLSQTPEVAKTPGREAAKKEVEMPERQAKRGFSLFPLLRVLAALRLCDKGRGGFDQVDGCW